MTLCSFATAPARSNPPKPKRACGVCGKTLQAIGSARKNGARHNDWFGRMYHKRCYKVLMRR